MAASIKTAKGTIHIGSKDDLAKVPTPDLLRTYNELSGRNTSKFADRKKAEDQTWRMIVEKILATPQGEKPEPIASDKKQKQGRPPGIIPFRLPVEKTIKTHRPNTKRAKLIEMLSRPQGATFDELRKATNWKKKDCYEGIRLLHYNLGYGLATDDDGTIRLLYPEKKKDVKPIGGDVKTAPAAAVHA